MPLTGSGSKLGFEKIRHGYPSKNIGLWQRLRGARCGVSLKRRSGERDEALLIRVKDEKFQVVEVVTCG
jgi:hypothetical protein